MPNKMYPSCNAAFPNCTKNHYTIDLELHSFLKQKDQEEFFKKLKTLIEKELSPKIVEWVYLQKGESELGNCNDESYAWLGVEDPHGNRSTAEDNLTKPFKQDKK